MKNVLMSLKIKIGAVEWGKGRETHNKKKSITLHNNLSQILRSLMMFQKKIVQKRSLGNKLQEDNVNFSSK